RIDLDNRFRREKLVVKPPVLVLDRDERPVHRFDGRRADPPLLRVCRRRRHRPGEIVGIDVRKQALHPLVSVSWIGHHRPHTCLMWWKMSPLTASTDSSAR